MKITWADPNDDSEGPNIESDLKTDFRGINDRIVSKQDFVRNVSDFVQVHGYANARADVELSGRPKVYDSNKSFWIDAINNNLRPGISVELSNFHVVEWLPSSPGRYFTREARLTRKEASHYISYQRDEYLPIGKSYLVLGGVGAIRLLPKSTSTGESYFIGATSSGVCHQGVPIVTSQSEYEKVINAIVETGGCIADLQGRIVSIPDGMQTKIQPDTKVPRYFVFADKITPRQKSNSADLLTTVAIMFPSGYHSASETVMVAGLPTRLEKSWSFYSFRPVQRRRNVQAASAWLLDYARRHSGLVEPPIFNDFDEHFDHFGGRVEMPLEDIVNARLNSQAVKVYGDHYNFTVMEMYMDGGSKYNISGGQQGAVGDNSKAENFVQQQEVQQMSQPLDLDVLADQLRQLAEAAKTQASEPEHQIAIDSIEAAQQAAEHGDESRALTSLKSAGKWAFEVAKELGTSVAAKVIEQQIGS